jgi:hypothetical protein
MLQGQHERVIAFLEKKHKLYLKQMLLAKTE